ncbi:hypothetical protein SPB21_03810 [Leptothoe sp. ISB3NOV94-8A]|uniref:Uncharacterized protein n=1 Tax=Adonisia turfae CCMR0081 TaxID=2292702 RepID=A0A6M0RI50_9CYAN|nr:hypothetical protein [Adonisia turfae]NEZ55422.1 hypothetical protein [Adonisia turfae CCMR0081]
MSDLKTEFINRWNIEQNWDYESGDDSNGELWADRSSEKIALEMLEQGVFFWEHRGWDHTLMLAISPSFMPSEDSQRLSKRLVDNAPLGWVDLNPRVMAWANGDFSEHAKLQEIVKATQPEWLDRLAKNRAARAELETAV